MREQPGMSAHIYEDGVPDVRVLYVDGSDPMLVSLRLDWGGASLLRLHMTPDQLEDFLHDATRQLRGVLAILAPAAPTPPAASEDAPAAGPREAQRDA
jgi:hypothetical protein